MGLHRCAGFAVSHVISLMTGEINRPKRDAGNFHGITTMLPVCFLAMKAAWASRSCASG